MIRLRVTGRAFGIDEAIVGIVARASSTAPGILVLDESKVVPESPYKEMQAVIATPAWAAEARAIFPKVVEVASAEHLGDGDIVLIHPAGRVDTLFRRSSRDNTLFITDRCNSNCVMCSQPPRDVDDLDYHYEINRRLISLIPRETECLGITGGEPTILGQRLLDLLTQLRTDLPTTAIHALTNGRVLAWPAVAEAIGDAAGGRLTLGIPLYSDSAYLHDFVVQARNAFAQTVLGMHNCARYGIRVEIRVVVHQHTYARLPQLARFVHKNMPFVEHVAIMGLEDIGYARLNRESLWIEPEDCAVALTEAVEYLTDFKIPVSLYNMQLCLIPQSLHEFAKVSISDWKREYLEVCQGCALKLDCGGVFGTSRHHSSRIRPILDRAHAL